MYVCLWCFLSFFITHFYKCRARSSLQSSRYICLSVLNRPVITALKSCYAERWLRTFYSTASTLFAFAFRCLDCAVARNCRLLKCYGRRKMQLDTHFSHLLQLELTFFFSKSMHVVSCLSNRLGLIENLIMHGKNDFVEIFKNFS